MATCRHGNTIDPPGLTCLHCMAEAAQPGTRIVNAYDNLRAAISDVIPVDAKDDRIDILTRRIAELVEAFVANLKSWRAIIGTHIRRQRSHQERHRPPLFLRVGVAPVL